MQPIHLAPEIQVLACGQVLVQSNLLGGHADFGADPIQIVADRTVFVFLSLISIARDQTGG
jgi:hypothetical protein